MAPGHTHSTCLCYFLLIQDVSVKATVSGYLVGLDSTLKYHNEGSNPVEVLFRFPLEESFAVVGLEVGIKVCRGSYH